MILDTKALSAAADRQPAALAVVARARRIALPVIVLGEFRLGIAQSRHRASYEDWLRQWIAAVEVLPVDEETTRHYAHVALELKRKGRPIPTNDVWIAALARRHSLPILSRDRHFDLVAGIDRIAW